MLTMTFFDEIDVTNFRNITTISIDAIVEIVVVTTTTSFNENDMSTMTFFDEVDVANFRNITLIFDTFFVTLLTLNDFFIIIVDTFFVSTLLFLTNFDFFNSTRC